MATERFADVFWGTDFLTSPGYDTLLQKFKDGRNMCKDVEKFLRLRAKVEEEYAKSIASIFSKNDFAKTETGTLKTGWEAVAAQTDKISKAHLESSRAMYEAAERVKNAHNTDKDNHKKQDDQVKRSFTQKTNFYKRATEAKRQYENKCEEEIRVRQEVESAQSGREPLATKEYEKLLAKHNKLKQERKTREEQYRDSVCSVEHARKNWEEEMTKYSNLCEDIELLRHNFLQNEMWAHSNIVSQVCVYEDDYCEQMRASLEGCDAQSDMRQFIKDKRTGTQRPGSVHFEPYKRGAVGMPEGSSNTLKNFFKNPLSK